MPNVIIVGAGVIGLSTALAIAEEGNLNYTITIISEHSPEFDALSPHYTSPWAGAHFRPFPSKDKNELRDYPLARETLEKFKEVARTNPESSIRFVKGVELFEAPSPENQTLAEGWTEGIENFRVLNKSELFPGCVMGVEYDTFVVNAPLYLQYLYRTLKFKHDVRFVVAKLHSLKEAAETMNTYSEKPIVINCTGRGLQWEGGYDKDTFLIRGQTLLINAPKCSKDINATVTHQSRDGLWTFFIPRPLHGGIILGGSKQPGDPFAEPREEDTEALVARGTRLFPELMKTNSEGEKYFDIARVNVGFRPARVGGVKISAANYDGYRVIHGYGCGGSGYEFSWGVAKKILVLLEPPVAKL